MKTLEKLTEQEVSSQKSTVEKSQSEGVKLITVCRELTKIFEQVVQGTATEVKKYFDENPDKVRGEFVVIVSVAP
jgi:16S rRNA C1402 (ribose-2'-O) methylase RsmI